MLERRARTIVAKHSGNVWDDDPIDMLTRQIRLSLEHMDRVRSEYKALMRSLLRNECEIGTELMQLVTWWESAPGQTALSKR